MGGFLEPKIAKNPKRIDSKRHHKINQFLDRFLIDFSLHVKVKNTSVSTSKNKKFNAVARTLLCCALDTRIFRSYLEKA